MQSSKPTLTPSGMNFAMRSTVANGSPSTRPTSRVAAFAASLPKVMICATRSRPYFATTYSITRSRPCTEKSMSMSGIDLRPGFRKRSKSRS